jgi:hypothetical protein
MEDSSSKKNQHQSGTKVALGILGFVIGLTALLLVLKLLLS